MHYTWVDGTRTAPACEDCVAGKFNNGTAGICVVCDVGRYSSNEGAKKCEQCEEGELSWADRTGCGACDAGTFVFNDTSCEFCTEGKYAPSAQTDDW